MNNFDEQGRIYQTQVYSVDQSTGAQSSSTLNTNFWFDHRSNLVKESDPAFGDAASGGSNAPGVTTKSVFDGAERLKKVYTTDGGGDTTWADALTVTGDIVLEQTENQYDANSNLILTIFKQHFHDNTTTGEPVAVGGADFPVEAGRDQFGCFFTVHGFTSLLMWVRLAA